MATTILSTAIKAMTPSPYMNYAIASAFLGDYKDGLGIVAIVILIAVLGFTQEYRAQKAIVIE